MITITKKEDGFDGMRFCARAVTKEEDSPNPSTHYLNVTARLIEGTDGHRLHEYTREGDFPALQPGLYRINRNNKEFIEIEKVEEPVTFPQTSVVWPAYKDTPCLPREPTDDPSKVYTRLVRSLPQDYTINFYYFADVGEDFDVYPMKERSPVVFQQGRFRAIIMTLKM